MKYLLTVTIFSLGLLLNSQVQAQDAGRVEGRYRVEHKKMTGVYDKTTKGYIMVSAITHVSGQAAKATGVFKDAIKPVNKSIDKIVGKDIMGQISLNLNGPANPSIRILVEVNDRHAGHLLRTKGTFDLPVEIVEGTWQDYIDGKPIRLKSTPVAKTVYENAMSNGLIDLVKNTNTRTENEGQIFVEVKPKLMGPIELTINRESVTFGNVVTEYDVIFGMKL